jgi:hypothetical protein
MALEGSLDLFVLLVTYTTGSIFLALLVWGLILLVTGIMGRMSMQSILIIITTYLLVASVGYVGALAAVPLFLWAAWYATTGILNYVNQMR